MPKIGPDPKFAPPPVVRRRLSNGLEVLVAERHELPIVSLRLEVKGGETLVPADKQGLASMTAALLTEGTSSRNSLKLASDLAELGADITATGGLESSGVSLTTLTKHLTKALELYTDVLLNPSFPASELNRLRGRRLAAIRARADSAPAVAGDVFARLLYGDNHPYGRPGGGGGGGGRGGRGRRGGGGGGAGTLESIAALTRDDVVGFHKTVFLPNNASLIVVGDVTPEAITATLEKAIAGWKPGDAVKAALPAPPSTAKGGTVFLVDKPAAAQSVLTVGQIGVPRVNPDYFPLTVMNALLGGEFSSRINLNLREDKGYTYGAGSNFAFRQGPGPFAATTSVQTAVTKEALSELMKELTDVTGPRPASEAELAFAKERIARGFPSRFDTAFEIAGTLSELVLYNLPDDYFTTYTAKVEAVTKADVDRVARTYLDPSKMTILVVGDRSKVEGSLKSLPFAKQVAFLDSEGNPLPPSAAGAEGGGK